MISPRMLALTILLALPATGLAQFYRPTVPVYGPPATPLPRVTPYLGLLRGGNPAANYYLGVQPEVRRELDMRLYGTPALPDLFRTEPRTRQEIDDLTLIPIQPQSGHPAGFNLTGPFYTFPTRQRSYTPFAGQPPAALPPGKAEKKGI